jgi:general nucleoside transport system permease protein
VSEPAGSTLSPPTPQQPSRTPVQRLAGAGSELLPNLVVTLASIVLALLVGAVLIIVSNQDVLSHFSYFFADPLGAVTAAVDAVGRSYWALLTGAFGSGNAISQTLTRATPLICGGLAVSLAFRVGLFNIGAQGQLIMGAICSAYVGFSWNLPVFVHLVVALIAGLLGGAVWGGVVGLLKARTGAHEVIVTIMLNYVALSILRWLLSTERFQVAGTNNPKSPVVDADARFPQIFTVHIGFLLALLAAVAVWWLLGRTTHGFQMRAVGANPHAARTAGMSVAAAYTLAMVLAGALAGLAGAQQVLGHQDPLTDGIAGTIGFDSITVALLGRATPVGTVFAGLLFGALASGGLQMQAATNTPLTLTTVLQALIVLFVAAPALVRAVFRIRESRESTTVLAKGWNA